MLLHPPHVALILKKIEIVLITTVKAPWYQKKGLLIHVIRTFVIIISQLLCML